MTVTEMNRRIAMVQQAFYSGILNKYEAINEIKAIQQEFLDMEIFGKKVDRISLQEFLAKWTN